MDSVYLVWYDNGEEYDDHYDAVDKVFRTREGAERYLEKDLDLDRVDNKFETIWCPKKAPCPFGFTDRNDCARQFCPMFSPSENDDVLTGVRECEHEELLWDNEFIRHYYTVEQREVN